jgi:hypothetical protein
MANKSQIILQIKNLRKQAKSTRASAKSLRLRKKSLKKGDIAGRKRIDDSLFNYTTRLNRIRQQIQTLQIQKQRIK